MYVKESSLKGFIYNGRNHMTFDSVLKHVVKDQTELMCKNIMRIFNGQRPRTDKHLMLGALNHEANS